MLASFVDQFLISRRSIDLSPRTTSRNAHLKLGRQRIDWRHVTKAFCATIRRNTGAMNSGAISWEGQPICVGKIPIRSKKYGLTLRNVKPINWGGSFTQTPSNVKISAAKVSFGVAKNGLLNTILSIPLWKTWWNNRFHEPLSFCNQLMVAKLGIAKTITLYRRSWHGLPL